MITSLDIPYDQELSKDGGWKGRTRMLEFIRDCGGGGGEGMTESNDRWQVMSFAPPFRIQYQECILSTSPPKEKLLKIDIERCEV